MAKFKDGAKISSNVFRYLIRNQTGRVPNGPIPGSFKPTSGRNRGGRPYYGTVDYPRQLEFSERRKFDLEETQINVVYVRFYDS